jgi:hypothetical protein
MSEIKKEKKILPDEIIISKIYFIRDRKVMIDRDLAELYSVETGVLNQAVKRNIKRFPKDFMFQMSLDDLQEWKSQIVISRKEKVANGNNHLFLQNREWPCYQVS